MGKDTIELIIYAASVVLPSIIAILTLVKKTYFKNGISQLQGTINNLWSYNQTRFQQLTTTLTSCQTNIESHNTTISKYLQQQDSAMKIRQITKHALQYCGKRQLSRVIQRFTQQSVKFVQDILQMGFQNTNKQQIIAKLTVTREQSLHYFKGTQIVTPQQFNEWCQRVKPICISYLQQILHIYDDVVNNKNARFITTTENYVQKGIRQFILFAAKLDKVTRENVFGI